MTLSYRGFPVLTQVPHRIETDEPVARRETSIASVAGRFRVVSDTAFPSVSHPFPWFCATRAEIAAVDAFLASVAGRYGRTWVPTWLEDLVFVADAVDPLVGWGGLTVQIGRYAELLFPAEPRRHLVGIAPDGTVSGPWRLYRTIDNPDATTTLIPEGGLGPIAAPLDTVLWGWLTLCRLDTDDVTRRYYAPDVCDLVLTFTEVPLEIA